MRNTPQYIFIFLLLISGMLSPGVTTAIYATVALIYICAGKWKIDRALFALIFPFFLLLFLGVAWSYNHSYFDVLKDAWYLLKVVLAISVGYFMMRSIVSFSELCRLVVIAAVIASLLHFVQIALSYQVGISLMELRETKGVGGAFVVVIGAAILLAFPHYHRANTIRYAFILLLLTLSIFASMSRTNLVSFLLIFVILKGWGRIRLRILMLTPIFVLLIGASVYFTSGLENVGGVFGKLAYSINEIAIKDYVDMADINRNWRGFESYRALITYLNGDTVNQIFGQGFGSTVDLGFEMSLGGQGVSETLRFIPITHNGYFYVLLKFGALGLFAYMYFIIKLIATKAVLFDRKFVDIVYAGRLISALGWVFLLSSLVITGVFNIHALDSSLIILGASAAYFNKNRSSRKSVGKVSHEIT